MKKILLTSPLHADVMDILYKNAEIYIANDPNPHNYMDKMKEADGAILLLGKVDKEIIENCPKLKVLSNVSVGYDLVDVDTATKHGIPVCISIGANSRAVAEHTLALILAVDRQIVPWHNDAVNGIFEYKTGTYNNFELLNKKIGIIGLGNIGKNVAKICKGIGMEILGYDPFIAKEEIEKNGWVYYENYEDILKVADVVSVHVPLILETKDMITMKHLKTMKKSAILINCARGGIVNENDLADALNEGIIAGAGVDVYENEPPNPEAKILHAKNIVCSPHSASITKEAVMNMMHMCVNGCLAVLNGEKWEYVANPEVYEGEVWGK